MSQNWSKHGFDVITDITCNVGRCVPAGVIWIFPHGMWSSWFIEQLGERGIHRTPGGGFTNVSRAFKNNLVKIHNARNHIYGENFKLKLCMCAQSMALGTHTKFQLGILIRRTISAKQNFERISWRAHETLVKHPPDCRPGQPKVWNKNFKMAKFESKGLSARIFRADCKFVPSQWETVFLCNDISHWLGASLESDLILLHLVLPHDDVMTWVLFVLLALCAGNPPPVTGDFTAHRDHQLTVGSQYNGPVMQTFGGFFVVYLD